MVPFVVFTATQSSTVKVTNYFTTHLCMSPPVQQHQQITISLHSGIIIRTHYKLYSLKLDRYTSVLHLLLILLSASSSLDYSLYRLVNALFIFSSLLHHHPPIIIIIKVTPLEGAFRGLFLLSIYNVTLTTLPPRRLLLRLHSFFSW